MDRARIKERLTERLNEIYREPRTSDSTELTPMHKEPNEHAASISQIDVSIGIDTISQKEERDIRVALARIEEGTYGYCATCGGEISEQRLIAEPATKLCFTCADEAPQFLAKAPRYCSAAQLQQF